MRTFRDLRCAKFGCSVPDRVQKFTVKETNKQTNTQKHRLCIHGHSVGGYAKALSTAIIIIIINFISNSCSSSKIIISRSIKYLNISQ